MKIFSKGGKRIVLPVYSAAVKVWDIAYGVAA